MKNIALLISIFSILELDKFLLEEIIFLKSSIQGVVQY